MRFLKNPLKIVFNGNGYSNACFPKYGYIESKEKELYIIIFGSRNSLGRLHTGRVRLKRHQFDIFKE